MNIDNDDVEMQFKCTVTFTAKVRDTFHKHENTQAMEDILRDKIYEEPEAYMDDLEVTDVERLL